MPVLESGFLDRRDRAGKKEFNANHTFKQNDNTQCSRTPGNRHPGLADICQPEIGINERLNRRHGVMPEFRNFYELTDNCMILPRGYTRQLISLCQRQADAHLIRQSARQIKRGLEKILATYLPAPRNQKLC